MPASIRTFTEDECALQCDGPNLTSVDQILRTGVTMGTGGVDMRGYPRCRGNFKKIQEIVQKPGELLIFVRKLSWIELLGRH